jgi:hypothetical protein
MFWPPPRRHAPQNQSRLRTPVIGCLTQPAETRTGASMAATGLPPITSDKSSRKRHPTWVPSGDPATVSEQRRPPTDRMVRRRSNPLRDQEPATTKAHDERQTRRRAPLHKTESNNGQPDHPDHSCPRPPESHTRSEANSPTHGILASAPLFLLGLTDYSLHHRPQAAGNGHRQRPGGGAREDALG